MEGESSSSPGFGFPDVNDMVLKPRVLYFECLQWKIVLLSGWPVPGQGREGGCKTSKGNCELVHLLG